MKKNIKNISGILLLLLAVIACEKPEIGYISDNMFYNNSVYYVERGQTTYTAPLVANGSTLPLHVELTKVKDSLGEDVTDLFTEPGNIRVYTNAVTYQDSTLALLNDRFTDSLVQPFKINPIGGRMEFTAATEYLPGGSYTVDINVSNDKGSRSIENAANIILSEYAGQIYSMNYKRVTSNGGIYETTDNYISIDVEYTPGPESDTKAIYKFVDKNGAILSPSAGEIGRRALNFPYFDTWNPWYPVETKAETIEQQMPGFKGIKFPYYEDVVFGPDDTSWFDVSGRYDLKVPEGVLNEVDEDLMMLISFTFYTSGTFTITTHLNQYTKK